MLVELLVVFSVDAVELTAPSSALTVIVFCQVPHVSTIVPELLGVPYPSNVSVELLNELAIDRHLVRIIR